MPCIVVLCNVMVIYLSINLINNINMYNNMTNQEVADLLKAIYYTGYGDEVKLIKTYIKRAKNIYNLLSDYMKDVLRNDFFKAGAFI